MRWLSARTLAFAFLAMVPAVSHADVGVALRRVPVYVTLSVDRDYPEFAFFLVDPERPVVQRVSPTATDLVVVDFGDAPGSNFWYEVYVVPKVELMRFEQTLPPAQWFREGERSKCRAGLVHVRPLLDVFDNRDRIEKAYQIQRSGETFRVDVLSENQGNRWVAEAWGAICCGVPALAVSGAVALAGLWLLAGLKHHWLHFTGGTTNRRNSARSSSAICSAATPHSVTPY